jgi:hypothetical protein
MTKLIDPTDDELNESFAVIVAGFTCAHKWKHKHEHSSGKRGAAYVCERCGKSVVGGGNANVCSHYTESVDLALPYAESDDWWINIEKCPTNPKYMIYVYRERPYTENKVAEIMDDSLARGLVLALLRAHGIEIEFTK